MEVVFPGAKDLRGLTGVGGYELEGFTGLGPRGYEFRV